MLPLSIISFISTIFIGPYFDKVGRKKLLLLTCKNYCNFRWIIRNHIDY